jgi:hypothetical protein
MLWKPRSIQTRIHFIKYISRYASDTKKDYKKLFSILINGKCWRKEKNSRFPELYKVAVDSYLSLWMFFTSFMNTRYYMGAFLKQKEWLYLRIIKYERWYYSNFFMLFEMIVELWNINVIDEYNVWNEEIMDEKICFMVYSLEM